MARTQLLYDPSRIRAARKITTTQQGIPSPVASAPPPPTSYQEPQKIDTRELQIAQEVKERYIKNLRTKYKNLGDKTTPRAQQIAANIVAAEAEYNQFLNTYRQQGIDPMLLSRERESYKRKRALADKIYSQDYAKAQAQARFANQVQYDAQAAGLDYTPAYASMESPQVLADRKRQSTQNYTPAPNFSYDPSGLSGRPQYSSAYGYSTPTGRAEIFYTPQYESPLKPSKLQQKANILYKKSFLAGERFRASTNPREQIVSASQQAFYGYSSLGLNFAGRLPGKGKEFVTGLATGAAYTAVETIAKKQSPRVAGVAFPLIGGALAVGYIGYKSKQFAGLSKTITYEPVSKEYYYRRGKESFNVASEFSAGTAAELGGFYTGSKAVTTVTTTQNIKFTRETLTGKQQTVNIQYEPGNIGYGKKEPFLDISTYTKSRSPELIDITPSKGFLGIDRTGSIGGRPARERALSVKQRTQRAKPSYQPFRIQSQNIAPGETAYTLTGKGIKPLLRQGTVTTKVVKSMTAEGVSFEPVQLRGKGFEVSRPGFETKDIITFNQVTRVPGRLRGKTDYVSIAEADFNVRSARNRQTQINDLVKQFSSSPTTQQTIVKSFTQNTAPNQITANTQQKTRSFGFYNNRRSYTGNTIVETTTQQEYYSPPVNNYPRGSPQWRYQEALSRLRSRVPTGPRSLVVVSPSPRAISVRPSSVADLMVRPSVSGGIKPITGERFSVASRFKSGGISAGQYREVLSPVNKAYQENISSISSRFRQSRIVAPVVIGGAKQTSTNIFDTNIDSSQKTTPDTIRPQMFKQKTPEPITPTGRDFRIKTPLTPFPVNPPPYRIDTPTRVPPPTLPPPAIPPFGAGFARPRGTGLLQFGSKSKTSFAYDLETFEGINLGRSVRTVTGKGIKLTGLERRTNKKRRGKK